MMMMRRRCLLLPICTIATSMLVSLGNLCHAVFAFSAGAAKSSSHGRPPLLSQQQQQKQQSLPRILLCDVPSKVISGLEEQFDNRASLYPVQGWTDDKVEMELCKQQTDAVIIRSANTITGDMIRSIIDCDGGSGGSGGAADAESSSTKPSSLRVIGRAGVGLDNIDCTACQNANIPVVTAAGANAIAVAEHTFALIFALARKIKPAVNSITNGQWMKPSLVGLSIRGKTIGIIGFGAIGLEVAKIGSALGMNVLIAPSSVSADGHNNKQQQQRQSKIQNIQGAKESSSLEELLQLSDFVSIHLPLTDDTTSYISHNELDSMKSSAMLISVGRGGVVDEDALLKSLLIQKNDGDGDNGGGIAGAALDVFVNEGSTLNDDQTLMALAALDSTVITPHLGGHTQEAQADVWSCVVENVLNVLEDK